MGKMICDRGRSNGMSLFPACTWEGGAECSGLKAHRRDEGCEPSFCMRAGVHRQCYELGEVSEADKKAVDDYFERLG